MKGLGSGSVGDVSKILTDLVGGKSVSEKLYTNTKVYTDSIESEYVCL